MRVFVTLGWWRTGLSGYPLASFEHQRRVSFLKSSSTAVSKALMDLQKK
jgi:hypothetical protein